MDDLRIRAYNCRFGDAFLVTVPDEDDNGEPVDRHLLIDVGNSLATTGGQDDVFQPIFEDIQQVTGGKIDLYVSSHEHLDHVQGLLFAHQELDIDLDIDHLWITASAHPEYYDTHPEAKRKFDIAESFISTVAERLPAAFLDDERLRVLLENNGYPVLGASPRKTSDCVDFMRSHTNADGSESTKSYVHRLLPGQDPWPHPFRVAELEVLAPEEDTSEYYGRFRPVAFGAAPGAGPAGGNGEAELVPPAGVDAQTFYNLVTSRTTGFWDNLLAIDKAKNNTSVVFTLKWKGWTLLFPGDAEVRSYKEMQKEGVLGPVHFLKVGHHGSHNGTPPDDVLDVLLPPVPPDDRPRRALVSTAEDTYSGVPDPHTLDDRLLPRCEVIDTRSVDPGEFVDVVFAG